MRPRSRRVIGWAGATLLVVSAVLCVVSPRPSSESDMDADLHTAAALSASVPDPVSLVGSARNPHPRQHADGDEGVRPDSAVQSQRHGGACMSSAAMRRLVIEQALRARSRTLEALSSFLDAYERGGHEKMYLGPVFFEPFRPLVFCDDEMRIGVAGDGGKWVCNSTVRRPCVAYSFGSNGDTSFEEGVKNTLGCEMHTFDPTLSPERLAAVERKAGTTTLHPWGLMHYSGTADFPPKAYNVTVLTFDDIVTRLGHTAIDILKIDIETSEWTVLPSIFKPGMPYVGQLQLEIHVSSRTRRAHEQILELVENLERHNFYLFHTEINALAPGCTELAFVRLDLLP